MAGINWDEVVRLQWGRDQLIAELLISISEHWSELALQWGRDQLIAELNHGMNLYIAGGDASMGPRSIDRGTGAACDIEIHAVVSFNGAAIN